MKNSDTVFETKALEALKKNPQGQSVADLSRATGLDRYECRYLVRRLEERGEVKVRKFPRLLVVELVKLG